jgi:hypothetical protein
MMDSSKRQDGIGGSRLLFFINQSTPYTDSKAIPVLIQPHIFIINDLIPYDNSGRLQIVFFN